MPTEAEGRRSRSRDQRLRGREGFRSGRPHPLRRGVRAARAERAVPRLEGTRRAAQYPGDRRRHLRPEERRERYQGAQLLRAQDHAQRGQLHHLPGQPLPLAGPAGRRTGRGDLSGLRRPGSADRRERRGPRHRHRRPGRRPRRQPERRLLHPRHGAARQVHPVRRRLPRAHRQAADQEVQARQRGRCPALRYRHQGNLGHRPGQAQAGPGGPHRRLAAERRKLPAARSSTTWRTTRWWSA